MPHRPIYLSGKWTHGDGELSVHDPGNGETIATVATVGRDAARRAIDDAHAALPAWRATPARDRGDVLLTAAEALTQRTEEVATTLTRENGKPISESRKEVAVAVDHLRWFAEEGRRAYGRIVPPQAEGKRHLVLRQPIGVVAAISPWNFPLMLSARKVAPALAAGCPVILKPAERTPLCTLALAECFESAGLPAGVFQLLVGDPAEIAGAFFEHPDCRKVSFTGSTAIGRKLIQQSAEHVTKLSLELGGQAPLLVFDDADLDVAVDAAMGSKFRNTGQSCIASNRFYVQAGIHDAFVQRFTEKTAALKVGYGLDPDTDIGAIIDRAGLDKAMSHIRDAVDRGARVATGGEPADIPGGTFLQPTVLTHVTDDALCMTEETFGPVAPIARFDDEDDAVTRANDTPFGLAAYAYTSDFARSWRLAERLDAGSVCINDAVPSTSNCPFGGTKQSGIGRELGVEGLDAFLETRHISIGNLDA